VTGRATLFSLVAVPVYTAAYYFNWPLFFYYPGPPRFSFAADAGAGFAILWYGWVVTAAAAGAAAAFAVPRRWSDRLFPEYAGMMLIAGLFAVLLYEKRWFF
jgi:hypothetical protein